MSAHVPPPVRPYVRPVLAVDGPDRRAGGFYRTADSEDQGIPGVPLSSTEAVVVSAVRMGYRIAEEQIDRSARAARRLRDAAERAAGSDSGRDALDATDRVLFKAMVAGLAWLQALAADPVSPLGKLAVAQIGLLAKRLQQWMDEATAEDKEPARGHGPARGGALRSETRVTQPRILLKGSERRAVSVTGWSVDESVEVDVLFFCKAAPDAEPIPGKVSVPDEGRAVLSVTTARSSPAGKWRAPVCKDDGEQVGIVEITL